VAEIEATITAVMTIHGVFMSKSQNKREGEGDGEDHAGEIERPAAILSVR